MSNAPRRNPLGALVVLYALCGGPASAAETDSATLAKSWEFMQQAMPGVPYSLLRDACAEGTLSLYHSTTSQAAKSQVAQFQKRFPCIAVHGLELGTAEMRQRFLAESNAKRGVADLVQDTDQGSLNKEASEGRFIKYVIANDGAYPDSMKNSGYWYPLQLVLVGIAWNTDLVNEDQAKELMTWQATANPEWKGRGGATDPAFGGISLLAWYAWTKLFGESFIDAVGAQKPHVYAGTNPSSAALASGDVAVLFNASESGLMPLYLAGAPIRWSLPEPAVAAPLGQAISALAPHPNAARLYQEYAFTLEGYTAFQQFGGAPARMDFHDQRQVARESWYKYPTKFFAPDTDDVTRMNKTITDMVHQRVGGGQ